MMLHQISSVNKKRIKCNLYKLLNIHFVSHQQTLTSHFFLNYQAVMVPGCVVHNNIYNMFYYKNFVHNPIDFGIKFATTSREDFQVLLFC